MPSRDVMDNRIDAYENILQADQESGRGTWGSAHPAFGQTLVGNGKPSDQTNPGPVLPALMQDFARIDVWEGPGGIGWTLVTEAEEAGEYFVKRSDYDDDRGTILQSNWESTGDVPPVTGG